ncbi:Calx-beta domain-containing protein [Actinoplanes sp. NPDC026670]|uniref:Calx-beta domain-containing protein n=1 Tax=Actinoplanes sp. NPDC026670 TaxID=3154700 RepID=UPI0033C92250
MLATIAASAAGLIPVVLVSSPAHASVDYLTISDAGAWEGSKVTFTLTYTGTAAATFPTIATGSLSSASGAATPVLNTNDYDSDPSRTSITFPGTAAGGTNTATITVDTLLDNDTADETFALIVTDALSNTKSATGTIWAAASYPTFALSPTTSTVAETATKNASGTVTQKSVTITATLTQPLAHPVTLPVKTVDGTSVTVLERATSSGGELRDYTALPSTATITIPEYTYTGSITVDLYDDVVDETDTDGQAFTVEDAGSSSLAIRPTNAGAGVSTITITDDDAAPTINIGDAPAADEGSYLNFPLTLSHPSDAAVGADYATADGTTRDDSVAATSAGSDYTSAGPAQILIPAYGKSRLIPIAALNDNAFEGAENVRVLITNPSGTTLGTKTTGVGIINDTDSGPAITLSTLADPANDTAVNTGYSFKEGDKDEAVRYIAVTLPNGTGPWQVPIKIDYAFKDGTATNGVDYKGTAGSFTVPVGATAASWTGYKIPVTVVGDTTKELTEDFQVVLTSSTKTITEGNTTISLTETNETDAIPTWTTGDVSVVEGNTGVTTVKVPVTLSAVAASDVTFTAGFTTPGSATETGVNSGDEVGNNDYDLPATRTVTIKAGEKVGYLEIPINADTVYERDEALSVDFTTASTAVSSATSADVLHSARVTITNDDAKPTVTLNQISGTEGGSLRVTGTLSGLSQYPYTLGLAVAGVGDNPATPATDFELPSGFATTAISIARGATALPNSGVFGDIYLSPDDVDEPVEAFTVAVKETSPSLQGFTDVTGTYRINDDPADLPPAASIRDESIGEWEGSVDVHVDFAFDENTKSTTQTVNIPWWTVDGSAKAGEDYKATKGTLTLKPGDLTATVNVEVLNDKLKEDNENFWVKLGTATPTGAAVTKGTGEVTIKSEDKADPVTPTLSATGPSKGVGLAKFVGTAAPNTTVELWGAALPETDPKAFKYLSETTADDDGYFELAPKSLNSGWAFVARSQEINSAVKTVKVTQLPSFSASSSKKGKLSVSVAGNPRMADQAVSVQRYTGGKWVTIGKGTTTASGWKSTISVKTKSKVTLRAWVAGDASMGINGGYSAQKKVTIK